ncbi:MAG: hypothetical protein AB7I36_14470, partial [Rhodospirillaceae bacterium]
SRNRAAISKKWKPVFAPDRGLSKKPQRKRSGVGMPELPEVETEPRSAKSGNRFLRRIAAYQKNRSENGAA